MKLPFTYREALEVLSDRAREKVFAFQAISQACEKIRAHFKLEPHEQAALDNATRELRIALGYEVDRLSADPKNPPAPILSHAFALVFFRRD
jgi:hypothetical protein